MPIYLPPVSRRRFIAQVFTGASAIAVAHPLLARDKATDPNAYALFSDVHIAADPEFAARGVKVSEHLATAVREVLALDRSPADLFVCGDCAYASGQTGDYATLERLLHPLRDAGLPLHLALGNHDNRERFHEALGWINNGSRRPVPERQVELVRGSRVNWFMLDSLEKTESTPGLLGSTQLEWLAASLDANAEKPAIVMVHHNPGVAGHMGLKDTLALFEVIRPRKQVKAYIFGHTHTWSIESDSSGLHLINLPAVGYVFKEGDPSGWVHAHLENQSLSLEFHAIDRSHKAHGQKVNLRWRES